MKKMFGLCVLSLFLVASCVTILPGETWHMKTGGTVEAEGAELSGRHVEFTLKNGRTIRTRIDNLIDEDRVRLMQNSTGNMEALTENADPYKGQTIGQEIRAKQESEMTKLTALANFLKKSNYPYCLLKAQAQFDRKLITYSGSKASVTYTITVTFDEERFDDLVQPMLPMLDDLASKKQQGTIRQVSVSVKQLNAHGSGSTEKTVSMFGGNAFPERVSSDYIQLYVNTERTAGLKATQWMAYVLPKRSVLLLNLMERTVPAVRVAFLDSRGQEVTYRYVPGINSQCAVNGFYGKNRVIYGRSERFLEDEGENKHAESGLLFPRRYQAAPGRMSGSVSYPDYDTADVIHFMCPFGYTQYTSLNSRSYLSGGQFFSEFLMTVEATMPVEKLEQIDHLECTIVSENSAQDSAWLKLPDALKYYTDQVR